MDEKTAREIREIRVLQDNLRRSLDGLNLRLEQLEKSPEQTVPEVMPVLPREPEPLMQEAALQPAVPPVPLDIASVIAPPRPEPVVIPPPVVSPKAAPVSSAERVDEPDSLELRVGRVWLVRIGIVILLTGLVFLGNLAWTAFIAKVGPLGKLAAMYLAGFVLGGIGWQVRKREELAAYGKVLIGGALATVYYTTYAAHFVEALCVIRSPLIGGALLMALAVGIIWLADRMRSEVVAAATVVLGFYTAAINPIATFSLFSNLVLGVIGITMLLRRRWQSVSFVSVAGCYAAFAFWRIQATGSLLAVNVADAGLFWTAFLFPACYWLVFTAAVFLGRKGTFSSGARPALLTINNASFFSLTSTLVAGSHPDELWIFALAYGALLIALSFLAVRVDAEDTSFDGSYVTQGLVLVFVALLYKLSGWQLAISFALLSGMLLKLSRYRHGAVLQFFSGLSAVVAASTAGYAVGARANHAAVTATGVTLILLGNGWAFKYQRRLLEPVCFRWRAAGYVALSTLLGTATVVQFTTGDKCIYLLTAGALLMTLSLPILRLPEVVLGAQSVAAAALCAWFLRTYESYQAPGPFVVMAGAFLALLYWWQYQRPWAIKTFRRLTWQSLHTVALLAVILAWTMTRFHGTNVYFAFSLFALVLLSVGLVTRAWPLAIGSQIFSPLAAVGFTLVLDRESPWPVVLCTLLAFAAQSLPVELLKFRTPAPTICRQYGLFLRGISVLLAGRYIENYTPDLWKFPVLAAFAFSLFCFGLWRKKPEPLIYAGVAMLAGAIHFAINNLNGQPVFIPDFAGLLFLLVAQQLGRHRLAASNLLLPEIQSAMITAGVAGVWLMVHRMTASVQSGFLLTVAWSLVAFAALGTGFLLKERTYRILGLIIMACAVGRLFWIDVWQLETVYRILSFMILGVVLLLLGFLYNRFADIIRKWI